MKIGIDGTPLTIPFHCGLRHYTEELIKGLAKADKKNEYVIFTTKTVPIPIQKNFKLKVVESKLPVLKRQVFLTINAYKEKVDVFHYTDSWGSVFLNFKRSVMTFHDLAPASSYPLWYKDPILFVLRNWNILVRKIILKKVSAVIVISASMQPEIRKILNRKIPVYVIRHGVSDNFKDLKKKDNGYFLAMTDFSPRKNIENTLKAFAEYINSTGEKYRLKIVASTKYPERSIRSLTRKLKISGYVEILQDVSNRELVLLYNRALCFIFPSLYEGFGLPILEAMACGCPVITSDYGAMKEVAGNAAILVDPHDTSEIAKLMIKIADDKSLRNKMIKAGLDHAKKYTWTKTARETLKVYKKIHHSSGV